MPDDLRLIGHGENVTLTELHGGRRDDIIRIAARQGARELRPGPEKGSWLMQFPYEG